MNDKIIVVGVRALGTKIASAAARSKNIINDVPLVQANIADNPPQTLPITKLLKHVTKPIKKSRSERRKEARGSKKRKA